MLEEAKALRARKNADYGESWRELGALGVFVRWHDKYKRLRRLLWDGGAARVGDERERDTLIDALNYNLMMLYLHDQEASKQA
ncbi:hypothetical protein D3C72_2473360 [compost metagenome]